MTLTDGRGVDVEPLRGKARKQQDRDHALPRWHGTDGPADGSLCVGCVDLKPLVTHRIKLHGMLKVRIEPLVLTYPVTAAPPGLSGDWALSRLSSVAVSKAATIVPPNVRTTRVNAA